MKLLIGLGNPGKKYEQTWHNLGFAVLDSFLKTNEKNFSKFKTKKKFQAEIAEGKKIILAKPQTFMNNSGQAVRALKDYYKIKADEILVIHDDIDLPLKKLRISLGSTAGGHKGIESIINHLGTKDFIRLRLGIKSEKQGQIPTPDYVLQKIDKKDKVIVDQMIKQANEAINLITEEKIQQAMNQFN